MKLKYKAITFIIFILFTLLSHADFYVIPVVQNSCSGTPAGSEAFSLNISNSSKSLYLGDVYTTETGLLVEIIGKNSNYAAVGYNAGDKFLVAPDILPEPSDGQKGDFYYLSNGHFVFAKLL